MNSEQGKQWEHVTFVVSILVAVRGLGLCSQGINSLATYKSDMLPKTIATYQLSIINYQLSIINYLSGLEPIALSWLRL